MTAVLGRTRVTVSLVITTLHEVPYFAQWESPELIAEIIGERMSAADDPRWQASGAASREEYAWWAGRICGMACLRMVLAFHGLPVPAPVPLAKECMEHGGYVRDGDGLRGLIYAPFAAWVAGRWDLPVEVRPRLTLDEVAEELHRGRLVMISVHKWVRWPDRTPSSKGGHLVLVTGSGRDHMTLHNPSGISGETRQHALIKKADLERFFAGRGVVIGPPS
ncbi:hypothetical protein ETD85_37620 [Nonomuraea zeae]|uniref:Peptidase C39-like domain-containing protein n=2 Tax=Nonomuraea zeae TaxID=1642303 RepID=A0A5S4G4G1_9ACTN|nr:hypothetical protein ETD85_37620 [Nonomuraea zeae]